MTGYTSWMSWLDDTGYHSLPTHTELLPQFKVPTPSKGKSRLNVFHIKHDLFVIKRMFRLSLNIYKKCPNILFGPEVPEDMESGNWNGKV
jgi:hypothetical protein